MIAKSSMSFDGGGGGGGGGYENIYYMVGEMKVCVIAKLNLSESRQEFLYNIF